MKEIGGFFQKFNNKIAKEVMNLDFIIGAVKKHTGIALEAKNIKIRNGIVRIQGSSLQKNEIFIKKTRILKELEGKLQSLKVSDIQ